MFTWKKITWVVYIAGGISIAVNNILIDLC